jgi:hypothetical protein
MSAELHPDTEKYYQRVKRHLQEIGKWDLVLEKWSRKTREGEPITITGEQAVKTAVSHILDRCDYAGTDPEALDWDSIAELMPDYENPEDYLEGLTASQLVPPPSPSEEAFYTYAEQEIRKLIDMLFSLPPDKRKPLIDEIIQKSGALEKLLRDAEEARRLKKRVEEYNRKIKTLEEQLEALRRKAASPIVAPPPPAPTPAPTPTPTWRQNCYEPIHNEYTRAVSGCRAFISQRAWPSFLAMATRTWRDNYAPLVERYCREWEETGNEESRAAAEQQLRKALAELARLAVAQAYRKSDAIRYFTEVWRIPSEEFAEYLPPPPTQPAPREPAPPVPARRPPPGYTEVDLRTPSRVYIAPEDYAWSFLTPTYIDITTRNYFKQIFGSPAVKLKNDTVILHSSTYACLTFMAERLHMPAPDYVEMPRHRLIQYIESLLGAAEKAGMRDAVDYLHELLIMLA